MSSIAAVNGTKVAEILRSSVFSEQYDLQRQLHELDIPTLIIHGDTDPIPCSSAESLHQNIKCSKYVLMERCGHFPYVEDAQVFFNTVHSFLAQNAHKKK